LAIDNNIFSASLKSYYPFLAEERRDARADLGLRFSSSNPTEADGGLRSSVSKPTGMIEESNQRKSRVD